MKMPRVAYLILAHEDPQHLARLVAALDSAESNFFIHISRPSPITPFYHLERDRKNLHLLKSRSKIYWGGWNYLKVILDLLNAAIARGPFDYYTLISGNSFPLRTVCDIHASLKDFAYINLVAVPSKEGNKPMSRFTRIHWQGSFRNNGILGNIRGYFLRKISRLTWRNPRRYLGPWRLYAGMSWCTLSSEAADIIIYHSKNPKLMRYFKYVLFPEESFFHTVLGNTNPSRCMPMQLYQDWSDEIERPSLISYKHISELLRHNDVDENAPFNFARKFNHLNSDVVKILENIVIS